MSTSIQLVLKSTTICLLAAGTPLAPPGAATFTFSLPPMVSPGATSNGLGASLICPSWNRLIRNLAVSLPLRVEAETSIMSTLVGIAIGLDQSLQADTALSPPVARSAGRYGGFSRPALGSEA